MDKCSQKVIISTHRRQKNELWLLACSSSLAVAFPEAPTPIPSLAYHLTPDVGPAAGAEDLLEPAGTASIPLDSEAATETLGLPEQPDLPRQIHIQQQLKLHFHNHGEVCRRQNNDANP